MQNYKNVWLGLQRKQQIIVLVASFLMFIGIVAISRIAATPTMQLLYSGLESGTAGEVVSALEQHGVAYEVRGGSIFVDAASRDELRMTLASEGLPSNSARGYELLDSLSGFGTTSQMFDAAYWRAKEGELARTILASPHITFARVHIAQSGSNPFQKNTNPTASVSVTTNGATLSSAQAKALRFLVASAVAGLSVDDVAIVDARGNLIDETQAIAGAGQIGSRTDTLKDRVTRLLEARVGPGNAIVEVSVETITQSETIRERRLDPGSRVAISTDTEERTDKSKNQSAGVSVSSNLPDGDAAAGDDESSEANETRERINYEVSETEHEILKKPGDIKRLTVAALVNGTIGEDPNTFTARTEEELSSLRELIASAVGFEEERGDVITIKSMDLQKVEPLGTAAKPSILDRINFDAGSTIQTAVLAIVTLFLGLFVIKPILTNRNIEQPQSLGPPQVDQSAGDFPDMTTALTGEIDSELPSFSTAPDMSLDNSFPESGQSDLLPDIAQQDPVDRLRALIGERQEETVEILRSWLEEQKENT